MRRGKHNSACFALDGVEMHHRPRAGRDRNCDRHVNKRVLEFLRLAKRHFQQLGLRRFYSKLDIRRPCPAHHEVHFALPSFATLYSANVEHALFFIPPCNTTDADAAHDLPNDGYSNLATIPKIREE